MSTDQCQAHPEQQQQQKPHEESTIEPRKTREQRLAIYKREFSQNCVKVAKLSEDGTVIYCRIPTRSFWLRMVREAWGVTDEETTALIKGCSHHFYIDFCGSPMGCGVILRNSARSPIVALSRVFDSHVSQFYSDLEGVLVGLKVAIKYKIRNFSMICTSIAVCQYVMRSWERRNKCCCPARDEKKYCIQCSRSSLHEYHEDGNAGKILPLIDEIFYHASKFEGFIYFNMSVDESSRAKAVCYLANSGMDQDLSLPEIEEDEKLIEILYKDVYGHVSNEEEMVLQQQQLMFKRQQREMEDIHNKEIYTYYESKAMMLQKQGQEL